MQLVFLISTMHLTGVKVALLRCKLPGSHERGGRLRCGKNRADFSFHIFLKLSLNCEVPIEAWGIVQVPSTEQRDLLERSRKEVSSRSQGGRYFFISISFKYSLKKVETFIILVILVFELTHVRFLYGFFNKGVVVVRLMSRTTVNLLFCHFFLVYTGGR
jgi:hypothetical protein